MNITFEVHPDEMTSEEIKACINVLKTKQSTLESILIQRIEKGDKVDGRRVKRILVKDYQ